MGDQHVAAAEGKNKNKAASGPRVERQAQGGNQALGAASAQMLYDARLDPRALSPDTVLALQRTVGNAAINRLLQRQTLPAPARDPLGLGSLTPPGNSHLVAASAPAPIAAPIPTLSTGPLQRFIDTQGLIAKAGAPTNNVRVGPKIIRKKSTKYRAILTLVDRYHQEAQQLWTQPTTARVFSTTLNATLDNLTQTCWDYIKARPKAARVPVIRDLIAVDIVQERQRIEKLTRNAHFAGLDRTRQVEAFKDVAPATFGRAGIVVGETKVFDQDEKGTADCHSMSVWVEVDAGKQPTVPANAMPNSIYGITLHYWENVEIAYNFVATNQDTPQTITQKKQQGLGQVTKPWNDIMALQPDSPTWTKVGGPISKAWPTAVTEARNGTLRGKHTVGFTDNPGATPLPGKYLRRILRFRVVISDGSKHDEILATQVIELDGQAMPASKIYVDSAGNALGSARQQDAQHQDVMAPMAQDDQRLQSHGITPQVLAQSVPAQARGEVGAFVGQLLGNTAAAFQDLEMVELQQKFPTAPDLSGPHKNYGRMANLKPGTVDDYYAIAGMNLLPFPQPGWVYKQRALTGGGLLVAIMQGADIWKMYYTDNQRRPVGAQQVNVRSFAEIPTEKVAPYVRAERYRAGLSANERAAFDRVKQDKTTKKNAEALAKQARIQSFANDRATHQYLRAHIADYDAIERDFNATQAPRTLAQVLAALFDQALTARHQQVLAATGAAPTDAHYLLLYQQLSRLYPNAKALALIQDAFARAFVTRGAAPNAAVGANQFNANIYSPNRATLGSAPALIQIVQQHQNNPANLRAALMRHIKTNKGKAPSIEHDYNTVVPPLGLANVPPTLGEVVYAFFVAQLQQRGAGVDVFAELMEDYPAFQYRLKPAYRFLFGEAQLRRVIGQTRAAEAAVDVPDPGSAVNLAAKKAFREHAPFMMNNFQTEMADAKFDARYDPRSGELKIIVKLSFEFQDSATTKKTTPKLAKIKDREVGEQFSKNAWTPTAQAQYKSDFKQNVLNIWNPNARVIRCTRPGWEEITATPVFEIQEVPQGQGHNHVRAVKAVLQEDTTGAKKLHAGNFSAWGSQTTILREFDAADKISDPAVHRYLHQTEKTGNIAPAYTTDRTRLENRLNQFGRLTFQPGSGAALSDPGRLAILVQELNRLDMPPDLAALHPIEVEGAVSGGGNQALADQRATTMIQLLQAAGIANPLHKAVGAANYDGVIVKAGAADPAIVDTYVTKWSRISAAHEFGHMLGLMDEYYGAKSDEVVKQMISDGLLPPDTRGDHLIVHPPTVNQGEAPGQEVMMKLLQANDLSTPDFTMQDNAKSSSLMTGGYELWAQHFVTVWEALAKMTETEIDSKYWQIT